MGVMGDRHKHLGRRHASDSCILCFLWCPLCACVRFLNYSHAVAFNHKVWTSFIPCGNGEVHHTKMHRVQYIQPWNVAYKKKKRKTHNPATPLGLALLEPTNETKKGKEKSETLTNKRKRLKPKEKTPPPMNPTQPYAKRKQPLSLDHSTTKVNFLTLSSPPH